ncbi:MAG: hypothetical protein AAF891_00210 [Pseudomonadota bacterium]
MAEKWDPVTAADQTLIFTLMEIVFEIHKRPEQKKMWTAILQDVLPHVSQDHPIIAPMLGPVHGYIRQFETGDTNGREYYDAIAVLADFGRWRAARSYEVFQAQKSQPEEKETQT